jgi:hypothetical protein
MPEVLLMMLVGSLLFSGAVIAIRRFGVDTQRSSSPANGADLEKRVKYLEDVLQLRSEEIMKLKDEVHFLNELLVSDKDKQEKIE